MIGVSTLAFGKLNRNEIVEIARQKSWTIEFSSSFPYQEDMESFFESLTIPRLVHNYFPAPEIPFVMNLASSDESIRQRTIEHCKLGINLTEKAGSKFYSAHAGFCIDPRPEDLGNKWNGEVDIDRDESWKIFIKSVREVLEYADRKGVEFLIENNVTAPFNLRKDGQNSLLCADPDEIDLLMEEVQHPKLGILLDTAHYKVSANALDFDRDSSLSKIAKHVRYIHHSDNKGERDTNDSIDSEYWFLKHMHNFNDVTHVLEVKNLSVDEIQVQLNLLRKYQPND